MKKRNWLMTIAFAVLSLTIVSTMVIGSTYAKFTSQVSGAANAQAAGFLVAGTAATQQVAGVMAPGDHFDSTVDMTYFSQVPTKISNVAGGDFVGTGIFEAEKWNALVTYYNTNWEKIAAAFGYGTYTTAGGFTPYSPAIGGAGLVYAADAETPNTTRALAVTDVITTGGTTGGSFVSVFVGEIFKADNKASFVNATTTTATMYKSVAAGEEDVIPAMLPGATQKLTAHLTVRVSWVTPKVYTAENTAATATDNDLFDTFIGACVTAYATGTELILPYLDNGAAAAAPLYVIGTNGEVGGETEGNSGVTYAIAKAASATTSTIGLKVGLKADQVTASELAGYTAGTTTLSNS